MINRELFQIFCTECPMKKSEQYPTLKSQQNIVFVKSSVWWLIKCYAY